MEAGQILIDKKYHLDAMLLSQDMLTDWAFWFGFSVSTARTQRELERKRTTDELTDAIAFSSFQDGGSSRFLSSSELSISSTHFLLPLSRQGHLPICFPRSS